MSEGGRPRRSRTRRVAVAVCDDHAGVRQGIAQLLGRDGKAAVALEADSFQALVTALSDTEIDVVLLDVNLPDTNGLDGVAILTERGLDRPIVLMSSDATHAQAAERIGVPFYPKGADPAALVSLLRRAAGR